MVFGVSNGGVFGQTTVPPRALANVNTTVQYGGLTFGATDSNNVSWRIINVQGIGSPKSSIQVTPNIRQAGAWAGVAFLTERYITVDLFITAPDPTSLNNALDDLHAAVAFDDSTFTVNQAGGSYSLQVRRASTDVTDNRVNTFMARPTFQVVATDGRKLGSAITVSTGLPSTSGGLKVPFTVPFTIVSTVNAGVVQAFNPYNASGPVTVRIDGPVGGPIITHTVSGRVLQLSSNLTLGTGEWLDIDMDAQTVLANGTAPRQMWIVSRGWSQFDPGVNEWAFSAASYNSQARMTITATPAKL